MSDDVIARARAVLAEATAGPWTDDGNGTIVAPRMSDAGYIARTPFMMSGDARALILSRNAFEALLDVLQIALAEGINAEFKARSYAAAIEVLRVELERLGR